jgi:acyl transferase domain-containing protein/surfactin synthase thioesterase subunit
MAGGRDDLAVAAVNAPDRIVASGGAAALATLADALRQRGVAVMEIKASHAFHSALMDPMLEAFEAIARSVSFERPRIRWISTLTGEEIARAPDAQYWRDQIRGAVRFRAAIETVAQSPATYLEIGPGATLVNLGRRCLKRAEPAGDAVEWASSLSQESGEWSALLNAVRQLHLRGHPIRYEAFEPGNGRRVSLPTYPFQHRRWWLEPRPGGPSVAAPVDLTRAGTAHPFLGERLGARHPVRGLLDLERLSFLSDHRVFGRVVLPTTAVLETVLAAAVKSLGFSRPAIADFLYEGAVTIPPDRPIWVQLALDPSGARTAFRLESTAIDDGDDWHLNVTGTLRDDMDAVEPPPFPSHALLSDCQDILPGRFYRFLAARGLSYGPAFQGITGLWRRDDEAFARVVLPREVDEDDYLLHPAFLDACLHLYSALVRKFGTFDEDGAADANVYVPIGLESFHLYRAGVRAGWVHAITVLREGEDEARLKVDVRVYGEDGRAVALFRGVTIRETTHDQFAAPEEPGLQPFLYRLTWREASRPEEPASLARHWCLLADAGGVGRHLADSLRAEQCSADLLTADQLAGMTASRPDPDIADPSPFEALLERAPGESVGVVYLWALDTPPDLADDPPTPRALALGGGACVGLLKALDRARSRFRTPPRLWLVTRGAQAEEIGTTPVAVAQSPLWGLGRTIALEYPDLWGGLIDLPAEGDARTTAELLLSELKGWGAEDQIAVRRDRRLAARLVRAPIETLPPRRRLAEHATYWIVGGLGAVGLVTAEALVAAGARHLVLTGRHPSRAGGAAALEELRRRAEIVVMASDATSESEVEAVLEHVRERMPPLKGVIHAAAVFDDAVLANVTGEQFQRVLAPKVAGAWRVSRATRAVDLDFFVVFSSVLSLWGGLGQSAYTAANSFVDAIAAFRRAAGLPATVFNWGPWADAGSPSVGPAGAALWKQRGTSRLSAELSLDVLLRFLDGAHPQVVVCDTRWGDFLGQFPDVPPLFRELARGAERAGAEGSAGEAPESLVELVQWHVARVLGEDGPIPASQPLNEIGLDSLLTVTLANRLRQALKVPVPTAMLLKGPSIVGLIAELFPDASPPKALAGASNGSTARVAGDGWLIFPRPRTDAAIRLLCFPFAGGGAATYRPWTRYLDERIELVAIEPPGRQTRLDELPLRDLPTLVKQLVPALRPFLDKPFAVYGHCFGALVLFETVRALIRELGVAPAHVFVSGARPPDELHRQQEFEVKLLERLLKIPGYSVFTPIHSQPEEVFAEAILQFDIMATETFLNDPELRRLILPVTRADFEMSAKYRYTPEPPWDIPITCLTGLRDTYVSPENARSWSRFTRRRFQLFMVDTEHFLVVDDDQFVISVLNRELGHAI